MIRADLDCNRLARPGSGERVLPCGSEFQSVCGAVSSQRIRGTTFRACESRGRQAADPIAIWHAILENGHSLLARSDDVGNRAEPRPDIFDGGSRC